jgi:hypothetical protein
VDDQYSHPTDRLESVLGLDPRSTAPLDVLYTEILSVLPPMPQQLRILHAVWQHGLERNMDPEEIDRILNLRPGTCRLTLRGLNSLLYVPPVRPRLAYRDRIEFLHASFADYLCDFRRSGQWCVSVPWMRSDYLHSVIQMLSRALVTPIPHNFYRYDAVDCTAH